MVRSASAARGFAAVTIAAGQLLLTDAGPDRDPLDPATCQETLVEELVRQPTLADATHAHDRHDPAALEQSSKHRELVAAADERITARRPDAWRIADGLGWDHVVEHRPVGPPQPGSGFQAHRVPQMSTGPVVRGERIALPPRPVQRDHQVLPSDLPKGFPHRGRVEAVDDLGGGPGLDPERRPELFARSPLLAEARDHRL